MAFRDQEVCAHCGHHFRTNLEAQTPRAASTKVDPLHRTMQFTLPPLPAHQDLREPDSVLSPPPNDILSPDLPRSRPQPRLLVGMAAVALLLALIAGLIYFWQTGQPLRGTPSPTGTWEKTLTSRASQSAHLRFLFRDNGSGVFSWSTSSIPPLGGQAPLRWRLTPDGKLMLSISKPAADDYIGSMLIGNFNRQPWLWRVDRPRHRLVLGTLDFREE